MSEGKFEIFKLKLFKVAENDLWLDCTDDKPRRRKTDVLCK